MIKEALVKNSSDQEQVREAGKKERYVREQELVDMRFMLSHPSGRRFLWSVLKRCGLYLSSFTGNSETFFREGRRDIGLWLLGEISGADPHAYASMMVENLKKEEQGNV